MTSPPPTTWTKASRSWREGVAERLVVGREPVAQAFDERAEGVDREPGLVELGFRPAGRRVRDRA